MSVEMVLSIIAEDRPGLVRTLAELVTAHAGNWIESSMARLGGEFAGIVRVAVPDAEAAGFETALIRLGEAGISVSVRRDAAFVAPLAGLRAELQLTGTDHPGIIHEISNVLAAQNVSIEELKTAVFPGSMSGGALFSAQARIVFPEGLTADALRDRLETIAGDLMVDIDLSEEGAGGEV